MRNQGEVNSMTSFSKKYYLKVVEILEETSMHELVRRSNRNHLCMSFL